MMSPNLLKLHFQCICTGGFKFPHYKVVSCTMDHNWLKLVKMSNSRSRVHVLNSDSWRTQRNFLPSGVKLSTFIFLPVKHPSERTIIKTHFWVEWGSRCNILDIHRLYLKTFSDRAETLKTKAVSEMD